MSTEPILIVGAGPVGLVLALTLLRNGIRPRIIDKNDNYRVGQKGSGVQPRTIEIFKFLGILPTIMKNADIYPSQVHRYSSPDDGKPPNVVTMLEPMEGQDKLEQILRSHLKNEYDLSVELNTELISIEQFPEYVLAKIVRKRKPSSSGTVIPNAIEGEIEVTDTETETMELKCAYVVGADGARSIVRKQLGLTFLGESMKDEGVVTGDIYMTRGVEDKWRTWQHGQQRIVSLRPFELSHLGRHNFMIGGTDIDIEKVNSSREEIIKAIYDITGREDEFEFGELICTGVWRPNVRMVDRFGVGRGFVAGDAAHVHSPTGGQGMNSGVQDAFNLGWKLALSYKNLSPSPLLLSSYTNERLPVIAEMLDMTTKILHKLEVFSPPGPPGPPGAGGATEAAKAAKAKAATAQSRGKDSDSDKDDSFWKRGFEFKQLGVNYCGSGIVVDQRNFNVIRDGDGGNGNGNGNAYARDRDPYRSSGDGTLRAGDRAPEAPGLVRVGLAGLVLEGGTEGGIEGAETTLFEIFGPTYHSILVFPNCESNSNSDTSKRTLTEVVKAVSAYPEGLVKIFVIFSSSSASASSSASSEAGVAEVRKDVLEEVVDGVFIDRDGFAYKHYGFALDKSGDQGQGRGAGIVVVRPDAYVGALVCDGEGVKSYFERIFA